MHYRNGFHGARGKAGFTLIELMVVLVLMTLLSTLVVPSAISAMRHNALQTEGVKLAELVRFAYVSAIAQHRPVQVNLDDRRGLCWVSVTHTSLPWLEERPENRSRTLAFLSLPKEFRLEVSRSDGRAAYSTHGWDMIGFRSDGRADAAVITLRDPTGHAYAFEIVGATGEIITLKQDSWQ
jgi:type II secretion system protein H